MLYNGGSKLVEVTMDQIELLTVEDSFEISGRGVVLIPDFSVPSGWKDRVDSVILGMPDGQQIETNARFNLSHFNLSDREAPLDKRWRVVVLLPDWKKGKLPVGSKLLVSAEIRHAIFGAAAG